MNDRKQKEKKDTATKIKTKRQSGAATSVDDALAPERDGTGVEQPNAKNNTTTAGSSNNETDPSASQGTKKKGRTPRAVDLVDLDGEGVAVEYVTVDEARHRALKALESGTQKAAEKEKMRKKFRVDQDEFSLGSI
jgi:hypothetical protein